MRVGYGKGPFDVSLGHDRTSYVSSATAGNYTNSAIGATWDTGVAKVFALYSSAKVDLLGGSVKKNVASIGVRVPFGNTTIRASYARLDDRSDSTLLNANRTARNKNDADQFALGAIYSFSKRTAIYGTYSKISNKGQAAYLVSGGVTPAAGQSSTGLEFGLRHVF